MKERGWSDSKHDYVEKRLTEQELKRAITEKESDLAFMEMDWSLLCFVSTRMKRKEKQS